MSSTTPLKAVSNGIAPPPLDLPFPDKPEIITSNLLMLTKLAPNPRVQFIFKNLITHLHQFVHETDLTDDEWMSAILFLTRVGQTCTPIRQEMILLSDVLGVSALVDELNNPEVKGATASSTLGPFFTEDAPDVEAGGSIASEGSGEYMFVEGYVRDTSGKPISGAVIETWETDADGFYDTQKPVRDHPDLRGRIRSGKDGKYSYRAVVPVSYPIPGDGPVGDLLLLLGRHNMRPNHLHLMVSAPGYHRLTTALYAEGDAFLTSDAVFGARKSLIVKYEDIKDDAEARRRGFPSGGSFKLLKFDLVLATDEEYSIARGRQIQH